MRFRFLGLPTAILFFGLAAIGSLVQPAGAGMRAPLAAPAHASSSSSIDGLASAPLIVPIEPGDGPELIYAKNMCAHPKFPLVCVKQGGTGTLSIEEYCYSNGQPVDCGTVTWTVTTSNRGLTASFNPDPGNPTLETVAASASIKPGHYYQLISASCTGVPNCPADYKATIIVLK